MSIYINIYTYIGAHEIIFLNFILLFMKKRIVWLMLYIKILDPLPTVNLIDYAVFPLSAPTLGIPV